MIVLCRVYPRLCGGNESPHLDIKSGGGLSPLVRGKQNGTISDRHSGGSIPACAGETTPVSDAAGRSGVYPRLCGGNEADRLLETSATGLSPLVRGKPWEIHAHEL